MTAAPHLRYIRSKCDQCHLCLTKFVVASRTCSEATTMKLRRIMLGLALLAAAVVAMTAGVAVTPHEAVAGCSRNC